MCHTTVVIVLFLLTKTYPNEVIVNYFVTVAVASAAVHYIRGQRPVDIHSDNRRNRPSMLASNRAAEMNLENLMSLLTIKKKEKHTLPINCN